jgi:serine protease Do
VGSRRNSARSADGRQWSGIAVAAGTLLAGLAAAIGLVLQQLGGSGQPSARPSSPATEASTAIASASADPLLVRSIEALPGAIVQIETTGTFVDPDEGAIEGIGRGSGFIVEPTGIVLTNNHVVTGAETIKVWVGKERSEHAAEVLGVSECSDLAVIQLDTREPLPYLDWFQGPIEPPLDIYAAGFPLGDPEYTLTRGIVSRARGVIEEQWASVDDTIEHDANILGGSSGGPVVTEDALVVAVNYAGNDETRQSFAISRDEVLRILPDLQAGRDVTSVGINGYAVVEFTPAAGIWVASVEPDSIAARAGILPGDVVTELDGKAMAVDGTMAEYCQVLRAHEGDGLLPFTVYRHESRETLTGGLNGDPVEPGFAFATAVGGATAVPRAAEADEPIYSEDDTLYVEAPPTWSQQTDQVWTFGGREVGPSIYISSNVRAYKDDWRTPGAFIAASATLEAEPEAVLDSVRPRFDGSCVLAGRASFTRGGYTGSYDLWEECDGATSRFLTIAAEKNDGSHVIHVHFQAADAADLAVLDRMLVTLEFDPGGI